MKLVTSTESNRTRIGVVLGDEVVDLSDGTTARDGASVTRGRERASRRIAGKSSHPRRTGSP